MAHRSPLVIIDRVVVITSLRGKSDLLEKLLSGQPSTWQRLHQLLREKGLPVVEKRCFLPSDIHVIEANGQPLEDIRSTNNKRAVGNQLLRLLLELSANPSCTIYASLAGGRKTMSALLLTAMTVYPRPQDRVFHVLVNEPFEDPRLSPPFFSHTRMSTFIPIRSMANQNRFHLKRLASKWLKYQFPHSATSWNQLPS